MSAKLAITPNDTCSVLLDSPGGGHFHTSPSTGLTHTEFVLVVGLKTVTFVPKKSF